MRKSYRNFPLTLKIIPLGYLKERRRREEEGREEIIVNPVCALGLTSSRKPPKLTARVSEHTSISRQYYSTSHITSKIYTCVFMAIKHRVKTKKTPVTLKCSCFITY